MARFEMHLGANYDPEWICSLSDDELATEIIRTEWDPDLMRDLFWRADMLDAWEGMDEWDDELCRQAAKSLGVQI